MLGPGAVGQLLACHLKAPLLLFRQSSSLDKFQQHQHCLTLVEAPSSKSRIYGPFQAASNFKSLEKVTINTIFVTLKAFQVEKALRSLTTSTMLEPSSCTVVLMSNGIFKILEILESENILTRIPKLMVAANSHGCYLKDKFTCVYANNGGILDLGPNQNPNLNHKEWGKEWFNELMRNHPSLTKLQPAFYEANAMKQRLLVKIAVNAVINPLAALYERPNGELLNCADLALLEREIADILSLDYYEIKEAVEKVCWATSTNRNSMWMDFAHGRPTEWDFINGWLMEKAPSAPVLNDIKARLQHKYPKFREQEEVKHGNDRVLYNNQR